MRALLLQHRLFLCVCQEGEQAATEGSAAADGSGGAWVGLGAVFLLSFGGGVWVFRHQIFKKLLPADSWIMRTLNEHRMKQEADRKKALGKKMNDKITGGGKMMPTGDEQKLSKSILDDALAELDDAPVFQIMSEEMAVGEAVQPGADGTLRFY